MKRGRRKLHYSLKDLEKLRYLQQRAYDAVCKALKNGTITRPDRCSKCDAPAEGKQSLEAHHPEGYGNEYGDTGYELEIQWLCRPCHADAHREVRDRVKKEVHRAERN